MQQYDNLSKLDIDIAAAYKTNVIDNPEIQ
jgi:hypothetical protein